MSNSDDKLIEEIYLNDRDDGWCGHDVCLEALQKIIERVRAHDIQVRADKTADALIASGTLEPRYAVVKLSHLTDEQRAALEGLIGSHAIPTVGCVVVEEDWPMFEEVVARVVAGGAE